MDQTVTQKQRGWRGSEDLWLGAAYDLLVEAGIDAVKVMPLAKTLGLSRASFYWHFADRDALLAALIRRWEEKNTGNLVAQTRRAAKTISGAMFNLFDLWLKPELFDSRLDFAIRNWALNAPDLNETLQKADRTRIEAITDMFARFGYAPERAEAFAGTVYYTQIGYISMKVEEPRKSRISKMPAYVEILTGRAPDADETARFLARHGMG